MENVFVVVVVVDWFLYLVVLKMWSRTSSISNIWGLVKNAKSTISDLLFQKLKMRSNICVLTSPPGNFHEHSNLRLHLKKYR